MSMTISCRELGMDCGFMAEGETAENLVEFLMRHVQADHTGDWFELEEIHQAAFSMVKAKAA